MVDSAFKDTTATKKVFSLKKRIRAVSGGTSGSKTISILVWIADYGQSTKNEIITVVAESVPHLQLGAIRDFKNIMLAQGYWDEDCWNESKHIYTFKDGSFVEFISFDKFGKAHGPRRDVLFLNEANNLPYSIVDQLITRTRKIVWMDWNPVEEFWFYTEMLPNRNDIDFLGDGYLGPLTYLDNEAIDNITKSEIESHKNNKIWWQVYGEGKLGEIVTRIYKGWQVIDEVPHEARLEPYGLDYGYSNDPTAILAIYYYNGGYILDEVAYQKGLSNKNIYDIFAGYPSAPIYADSAEPKSNDELSFYGLTVIPAPKGQGSVNQGIQFVQGQKISVTSRSINILKEYRNYVWITDKNGKILNEPIDIKNHMMDALRYGLSPHISRDEANKEDSRERALARQRLTVNNAR